MKVTACVIERHLVDFEARARRLFYRRILVVAVAKMRVVESNDSGKTDIKDPRVIHLVAQMGKTLKYRKLDEMYGALREWHEVYEAADAMIPSARISSTGHLAEH